MDQEKIRAYYEEQKRKQEERRKEQLASKNSERIAKAVEISDRRRSLELNQPQKTKLVDKVASPEDIAQVVNALNDIIVSQTVTNDDLAESFKDVAAGMLTLSDEISALPKEYDNSDVVGSISSLIDSIKQMPEQEKQNLSEVVSGLKDVSDKISQLKLDPKIDVEAPNVDVKVPEINIQPLVEAINRIQVEVPETVVNVDTTELLGAMVKVGEAINGLEFPIPNYVLPFKDQDGKATQVTLGNTGGLAVQAADSPSIDAFARWRVSNPETIFDSKQIFDNAPLFWDDQEVSGSGTSSSHSTATASSTISVSATTAGKRIRQTYMRFNYQPGKSQLMFLTGVIGNQGTDIAARMGYFDDDNGIFLVNTAGTAGIGIRSSTSGSSVDNLVAQVNWNLDTMDGNGASGITLDFDKAQIFVIDFEWLGVGRVRTGFVVDGKIYYCHEFLHANNIAGVYMSTPNLPIRYEIEAGGTNPNTGSLEHICSSVISEGGVQDNGVVRYASTANTQVDCAVVGTIYAIKGIRLKSTGLAATVKMLNAAAQVQSASDDLEYILIFNPTVAGTPSWTNETNSVVQTATGATANTVTGGTYITGGYVAAGNAQNASGIIAQEIPNALLLGSAIDGTPDEIWLCARPLNNVNTLVEGSITWRELS